MPTADSLKRYSASSFSSWMGNCSPLQFSSKFGGYTKWIVPRQAQSHFCISQGFSWVQDVQACLYFLCPGHGALCVILPAPWHPSTSNPGCPGKMQISGKSLQALLQAETTPAPHSPGGAGLAAEPHAKTGTHLPSPATLQCEPQNSHTAREGKIEKCSSHSRYLLSTYCLPILGLAWQESQRWKNTVSSCQEHIMYAVGSLQAWRKLPM